MYYKVMKDNKVLDLLTQIEYVRLSTRNLVVVRSQPSQAEGFVASDGHTIYKTPQMNNNVMHWDVADLIEIDESEYNQLKMLNGKTPQEIIDAYTLSLMEEGIL